MNINFDTYRTLYAEAREYDNIDMYIMERGWQDWMDGMETDDIAALLREIYEISRNGIEGMLAIEGVKLTVFCRKYLLPYDTAQKWRLKTAVPAEYTLLLLGWAVISGR